MAGWAPLGKCSTALKLLSGSHGGARFRSHKTAGCFGILDAGAPRPNCAIEIISVHERRAQEGASSITCARQGDCGVSAGDASPNRERDVSAGDASPNVISTDL